MFRRLALWICKRAQRRAPDFVIGDTARPYMLRWWIIPRNQIFNIYLHDIQRSDDDRAKHDHPWPSLSYMIAGELGEHYDHKKGERFRILIAGDWVWRPANFAHRLEVLHRTAGATTLFITGPKVREWGFHCPKGWRHWTEFVKPGQKGQVGRGCEG